MAIVMPRDLDTSTMVPETPCPYCGSPNSKASGDHKPKPNDFALCAYCAEVLVYDDELRTRMPTGTELEAFYATPELAKFQAAAKGVAAKIQAERKR